MRMPAFGQIPAVWETTSFLFSVFIFCAWLSNRHGDIEHDVFPTGYASRPFLKRKFRR